MERPVLLFRENWHEFASGYLWRDNTARGEYMTGMVPANPGGWYHASSVISGAPDEAHSPFRIQRRGRHARLMKDHATPPVGTAVVLTRGPEPWQDYEVCVRVRFSGSLPVGVVARYQTARDFLAAVFEGGAFKLVRMNEGVPWVLAARPARVERQPVTLRLRVAGSRLAAQAGRLRLEASDATLDHGGVGLWAEGVAEFGPLVVWTSEAEARRLTRFHRAASRRLVRMRRAYPAMEQVAEVPVHGHAIGRQLRLADVDGDGRMELIFGVPGVWRGRHWTYRILSKLSVLTLDGQVLWERGTWPQEAEPVTLDLPFQSADRGEGPEIVAAFGPQLQILDGRTGCVRRERVTPAPPRMEPWWDELSQYWGDGHGDDVPHMLPDSIRLCNLTGRHPWGDLLIKDRYHCAWALDGRTLRVLWSHRCNTGHYPFTCDLEGCGRDMVVLGYSRLDHRGRLLGRLALGDHPDASFAYLDAWGVRRILHPCGEAGLVDERSDGKVVELHLGHVQHLSVADFDLSRPGLERIVVTFHGSEGALMLLDEQDRVLRQIERYGAGAVGQPVNWTGDGRELIAFSPRLGDGGLWNEHFDLVVPFPSGPRPARYLEVQDVLGWGVDQLLVWDEERLYVYAPSVRPRSRRLRYAPVRPWPNLSNYQVNFSIPRWKPQ